MAHVSGNATWADYPSISTLITAAKLEAIEAQLDRQPSDLGVMLRRATSQTLASGNQIVAYATSVDTTAHVTVTSNTVFTLNTTGLWLLSAGAGDQSSTATSMVLWIEVAGGGTRYVQQTAGGNVTNGFPNANVAVPVRVTATTQLSVGLFSSAGVTLGADPQTFVSLALLRAE